MNDEFKFAQKELLCRVQRLYAVQPGSQVKPGYGTHRLGLHGDLISVRLGLLANPPDLITIEPKGLHISHSRVPWGLGSN